MKLRIEFEGTDAFVEWPKLRTQELIIQLARGSRVVNITRRDKKYHGPITAALVLAGRPGASQTSPQTT